MKDVFFAVLGLIGIPFFVVLWGEWILPGLLLGFLYYFLVSAIFKPTGYMNQINGLIALVLGISTIYFSISSSPVWK